MAGLGTRFLPTTKAVPKELLPVYDRPALSFVVEEALAAGIGELLFVTARGKEAIADYFDENPALDAFLEAKGKSAEREAARALLRPGAYHFVRQDAPKGLGHAVGLGRAFTGDRPFAVFLPDDVIVGDVPAIRVLMDVHARTKAAVVGLERIPRDRISAYGVVAARPARAPRGGWGPAAGACEVVRVSRVVEKPPPEEAPSDLAIVGRYLLLPEIYDLLARTKPGAGGEIQISDALDVLARKGRLYGVVLPGIRYDTGTPAGLLLASVRRALSLGGPEAARLRWALAGCASGGC